jgi:hypothetical protein
MVVVARNVCIASNERRKMINCVETSQKRKKSGGLISYKVPEFL